MSQDSIHRDDMGSTLPEVSPTTDATLSVVIPALDFDYFLREAIESVAADIAEFRSAEIVLVKDGAVSAVPEWVNIDGRVRVLFTGERSGAASAINLGIRSSDADYIARLDADDIWVRGRARAQLTVMQHSASVGLVARGGIVIDEQGAELGEYPAPDTGDLRENLLDRNPIIHSAVMFRRSIWLQVGGYDEKLLRMQDYDLWLRIARMAEVVQLRETVVKYRSHAGQSSSRPSGVVNSMRSISQRRMELSRVVGRSAVRQYLANGVFVAAQLLRYARVRRPRYLSELRPKRGPGRRGWRGARYYAGVLSAGWYAARSFGRIRGECYIIRRPGLLRTEAGSVAIVGHGVMIAEGARIVVSSSLEIGDGVFISKNATLVAFAPLSIGARTLIGENVSIHTEDHGPAGGRQKFRLGSVSIGADVWIGAGAVITRGVTIGDGATVGANAVVTRDVGAGTTVGGVPAQLLRSSNRLDTDA